MGKIIRHNNQSLNRVQEKVINKEISWLAQPTDLFVRLKTVFPLADDLQHFDWGR